MKALKLIFASVILSLTVASCTEAYYDDPDHSENNWYVDEFTIKASDWKLVGGTNQVGSYYEYVFDKVPLSNSYYKGVVTAYLFLGYGTGQEVQTPLPFIDYVVENSGSQEVRYEVQYTYDVKADGTIAFKALVSDYYTGEFNPGTQHFRVAIVW